MFYDRREARMPARKYDSVGWRILFAVIVAFVLSFAVLGPEWIHRLKYGF